MTNEQRLNKIAEMAQAYPSLHVISNEDDRSIVWEGWLQPIRSEHELDSLLDDLEHDRDVEIVRGAYYRIAHSRDCDFPHGVHRLKDRIAKPVKLFKLRIEDFGDRRCPEARVIEPHIPPEDRVHLFGANRICSFAPWEHPWAPSDSIVDFTDQALVWCLKHTVYSQTKEWLGSERRHDDRYLLKTIGSADQCFCGSGSRYEKCHRRRNGFGVFGDIWLHLEYWLLVHNQKITRFYGLLPRNVSLSTNK